MKKLVRVELEFEWPMCLLGLGKLVEGAVCLTAIDLLQRLDRDHLVEMRGYWTDPFTYLGSLIALKSQRQ